jgi:glycerol uptake facilitator-like aquaporin
MIGEIFGTFIFAFFIFTVTRKGYLSGYMFGYFNISASLLVSRAFTFRKGCLNPIIGLYSQIIIAIEKSNFMLIFYSLPVIIGPILGGLLAAFLFVKFYHPLII